jgi:hypothetical protein
MPFTKGDPRINRKGRPRKALPDTAHEEEDNFDPRKNEFTIARMHMGLYYKNSYPFTNYLIKHGIIIRHEDESLEWTLNRESLAKLFNEWPWDTPFFDKHVKWKPIEIAFKLPRYSLRQLASNTGSRYYGDGEVNPDYEKIMGILKNF